MYSKEFDFRGDPGLTPGLATNQLVTLDSGTNHSEIQFPPLKTGYNNDTQVLMRDSSPGIFTSGQTK